MLKTIKSASRTLLPSVQKAHDHDAQARQQPTVTGTDHVMKKWLEGVSQGIKGRFGNRLLLHREKLTLSPEAVAQQAGITLDELGRIEGGEQFPPVETAERICEVLDSARLAAVG